MANANNHGTSNGTTDVNITGTVPASTTRMIPANGLIIYNADTVLATVTIQYHNTSGAVDRVLEVASLANGATWFNDWPISLDDTTERIEIYLSGAVTTNELDWFVSYRDEAQ